MINKTEFAKYLGITRQALYLRFKKGRVKQEEIDEFIAYKKIHNLNMSNDEVEKLREKIDVLQRNIIKLEEENRRLIRENQKNNYKKENYDKLLHRYQSASDLNLEYIRRYGTIKGLNDKGEISYVKKTRI